MLAEALSQFRENGLELNPKKCLFFQCEVDGKVSSNCVAILGIH